MIEVIQYPPSEWREAQAAAIEIGQLKAEVARSDEENEVLRREVRRLRLKQFSMEGHYRQALRSIYDALPDASPKDAEARALWSDIVDLIPVEFFE